MRTRQRGITFVGWLVLILPLVIVLYAGIRLAPIYLNYIKVARTLDQTARILQPDESLTVQSIQGTLAKEFDVESLDYPKLEDILVKRTEGHWSMEADYTDSAPLFFGIILVVKFDKVVLLGS